MWEVGWLDLTSDFTVQPVLFLFLLKTHLLSTAICYK